MCKCHVDATPEEFKSGGFILKTHQIFSVHVTPETENFITQQPLVILDLCLSKTRAGESRDYRNVIVFEKLRFKTWFSIHTKTAAFLFHFSSLKSVFEKLCFHNGSVWTVRLTGETELRFQISAASIMSSDCPKLWYISSSNHNLVFWYPVRNLKQWRQRRQRRRLVKNGFIFYLRISQFSWVCSVHRSPWEPAQTEHILPVIISKRKDEKFASRPTFFQIRRTQHFTLLFCRIRLRNEHSFITHVHRRCSSHQTFCCVALRFSLSLPSRFV